AALGALVVFLAVVFAVAILDQRSPRIRSDLDEHAASVRTVARGLTTLPAPGPCTRQFRGGRGAPGGGGPPPRPPSLPGGGGARRGLPPPVQSRQGRTSGDLDGSGRSQVRRYRPPLAGEKHPPVDRQPDAGRLGGRGE